MRCCKLVSDGRAGVHQCTRNAAVREGGKGWCKQHAPANEKARRDAAREKYQADLDKRFGNGARDAARLRLWPKMVEWLGTNGQHWTTCPMIRPRPGECTCGLSALIAEARAIDGA